MRQVYLNEYNMPTDNTVYLPYSSGLLQIYAQQSDVVNDNYEFKPILFQRDTVKNIIDQYDNPDVVGFSISIWNYRLSLEVGKQLKKKFPNSYIIFGGPSAPLESQEFFQEHPYVDLIIYKEGERLFKDILVNRLNGGKLPYHTTISCKDSPKDLDIFPSPYTGGVYTKLIKDNSQIKFKAIIETNRGCPFKCAYCFWGVTNIKKKIGFHSDEYIRGDAEWISQNKIEYIFCADANFGMYKNDVRTAQTYVDIKNKNGYPEKFRVCYGKNATNNIFQTASILSRADLAKNISLSVQTTTDNVLQNIGRKNIRSETFEKLQKQYTQANIPTYTEIILGLPGETYDSYLITLQQIINMVQGNHIFVYHCVVLPNTKLASKNYQNQHKIQTILAPLAEVHGTIRDYNLIQEFEEVVIGTNTMPPKDWIKCATISWIVQLFHSFKVGYDIVEWLVKTFNVKHIDFYEFLYNSDLPQIDNFKNIARNVTMGHPRCQKILNYGNIYYDPEEVAFLDIIYDKYYFYNCLYDVIKSFLKISQNINILDNIECGCLIKGLCNQTRDSLPNVDDFDSLQEFATQTILYGRKSTKKKEINDK